MIIANLMVMTYTYAGKKFDRLLPFLRIHKRPLFPRIFAF